MTEALTETVQTPEIPAPLVRPPKPAEVPVFRIEEEVVQAPPEWMVARNKVPRVTRPVVRWEDYIWHETAKQWLKIPYEVDGNTPAGLGLAALVREHEALKKEVVELRRENQEVKDGWKPKGKKE